MAKKKIKGRSTVYNYITTPEKVKQINPKNMELQKDFLDHLSSLGRAESTIFQYEHNLMVFWMWNLEYNNNKFFVDLKKRELAKFQSHTINEWGWSSKRVRAVKSTLSRLGKYIEDILDDEFVGYKSIILSIESPPDKPVRQKTVFTLTELQRLLDKLVDEGEYMRACALSLAMNSGRRKAELPRFKVSYFDKKNLICDGALYKTPEPIVTKGRGIGGKLLEVYTLAKPFQPYLDLWLEERKRLKIKSDWLFPTYLYGRWYNKPITVSTLDSWADSFSSLLDKHFYWHSLRHFFTTRLSESNIPESVIQDIVGWESIDMVNTYIDTQKDKKFDKYFGGKDGIKNVESATLTEL